MPARCVNIERDPPLLLPPDLRQWVPENHLAHSIVDAVDTPPLTNLQVNERGPGDAQDPPRMMLSLLSYCSATGTFGSRAIEPAGCERIFFIVRAAAIIVVAVIHAARHDRHWRGRL